MSIFKGLTPEPVWSCFEEICKVPRPSKKEEKIIAFLLEWAKKNNIVAIRDDIGNIIMKKPAFQGQEKLKTVVLQCHVDMVCEKNSDVQFNFEKDAIQAYIDGEWVKAKGTTLGADDGIGMAAQMAVLTAKDIKHGPLECLFTVHEETGLTGAFGLKPGFFDGKILINLDSEDEGRIFIGCAGGIDTVAVMQYNKEKTPSGHIGLKLTVKGLKGGHSGDDIEKGRGNANKILNRILWKATGDFDTRLSSFDGGNLRNAIPREAFAIITLQEWKKDWFEKFINSFTNDVKFELL
ncbi:MAG: beta-Ala-His dipeptidase, partial [Bacteroidia bacterium]|nr:beta-Ala-His dipeptidase [Bacteroidia bacterium]